uniref:Hydroxycinnamic acids/hydroxycinnamoyl CoA esters OMT n=2 Tax=Pinus subgen. Pinus TaxID=139271 RepID=A0A1S6WNE1_PINSY|nr:hydroxycinnamic acids/hydroxycinnamoyl CoA esters OMT [Pinus sylvestris]
MDSNMNGLAMSNGCEISRDGFFESEEEELQGQAEAWKCTFAFAESLAVKCVVLLGIPDMIAREGPRATLSLDEIVAKLPTESPDAACLFRIMRFLVAKGIFRASKSAREGGAFETRYGLTPASKWLVKGRELSMAPMLLMQNDKTTLAPWHHFNECVLEGGVAFKKANGAEIWSYASDHPDFNNLFNNAMACNARIVMKAILSKYQGFHSLNSLVDVGGGTGTAVAEIVRAYPFITGINYDLPHVVATASSLSGVQHVGGDMFETVPTGDAIFMKWIMHDWNDEDCIKILKNCRKAIPDTGKVIIVDVVLDADQGDNTDKKRKKAVDPIVGTVFDLVMVAHSSGGKERTEKEWKRILLEGGFSRYNIIEIPALQSVIEAFPR